MKKQEIAHNIPLKPISINQCFQGRRFKTSKYNTLEAKPNAYNYITTDSEFYSNIYEEHRAAYEGKEMFGHYDLKTLEWTRSAGGTTHTFGPLIKVNGAYRNAPCSHRCST